MANQRIDPASYGPQQGIALEIGASQRLPRQPDVGPGRIGASPRPPWQPDVGSSSGGNFTDSLDNLKSHEFWLSDQFAGVTGKRLSFDNVMKSAMRAIGASGLLEYAKQEELARESLKMAQETLTMSDRDFERLLGELESAVNTAPQVPTRGPLQFPNQTALGVAALAALLTPEHAFDIGAAPFQAALQQREMKFQQDQAAYGHEMALRAQKLDLIEKRLEFAAKRRQEASNRLMELADRAARQGDERRAQALGLRADLARATSEPDLDTKVRLLQQYYPEFVPSPEEIAGIRAQIKLGEKAATDKAKLEAEKIEADRVKAVLTDFQQWIDDFRPADREITAADVAEMREQAKIFASDSGVPLAQLTKLIPGVRPASPSLAFQQERWAEGAIGRALSLEGQRLLNEGRRIENEAKRMKPPPEREARAEAIRKASADIYKQRIKVDELLATPPPLPTEEQKAREHPEWKKWEKWASDSYAAIRKEYAMVMAKRRLAGGATQTIENYLLSQQERFATVIRAFGWNPTAPARIEGIQPTPPKPASQTKVGAKQPQGEWKRDPKTGLEYRIK